MSYERQVKRVNLAEQQELFEDEVVAMDAELLETQRSCTQRRYRFRSKAGTHLDPTQTTEHQLGVLSAIRDFHKNKVKPKTRLIRKRLLWHRNKGNQLIPNQGK